MRDALTSAFASLAIHGLLAAGIAIFIDCGAKPTDAASLDLASVELSFAEVQDEKVAAVDSVASVSDGGRTRAVETEMETEPVMDSVPVSPLPEISASAVMSPPRPEAMPPERIDIQPAAEYAKNAPRQAEIEAMPMPCSEIRPDYPRESRKRGESGSVTLEIDVDADGSVGGVRLARSSGFALLDKAAIEAVVRARFVPAKAGEKPVSSTVSMTLEFRLKGNR